MLPVCSQNAEALSFAHFHAHGLSQTRYSSRHFATLRFHHRRYSGIQCVAFVRHETGLRIRGNAADWWSKAEGAYDRGNMPEPGAVLSFRPARRMPLGHVAIVRKVIAARAIEIDHAHWAGRGIFRNISVIDVSPNNNWTAVRVAIREGGRYGSIYSTNGFIYDRAPGTLLVTTGLRTDAHIQAVSMIDSQSAPTSK